LSLCHCERFFVIASEAKQSKNSDKQAALCYYQGNTYGNIRFQIGQFELLSTTMSKTKLDETGYWSEEKLLKQQSKIKVYNTEELFDLVKSNNDLE